MSAATQSGDGGIAWSEDPRGRELSALRVDYEGAHAHSLNVPRLGALRLTHGGDPDLLAALRARVLETELELGGPVAVRWRSYGEIVDTYDARLIDEPLPWGGGPGRGLPHAPHPSDRWSRANAGEVIPNVMTPLSWSVIGDPLDRGFHEPWGDWTEGRRFVALYDGYAYFNFGLLLDLIEEQLGFPSEHFLEAVGGPEAAATTRTFVGDRAADRALTKIRWSTLLRRLPYMLNWLRDQDTIPKNWPAQRATAEAERDRLKDLDPTNMSEREILRELIHSGAEAERQTIFLMRAQRSVYSAAQGLLYATDRWIGSDQRNLTLSLLQGLPGVRTQEGNLALRRIAARAATHPQASELIERTSETDLWPALHNEELAPSLHWLRDALDQFMAEYGHRAAGELEISEPRWVEQPELILDTFRDYVLNPDSISPDELFERQRQASIRAQREIKERLYRNRLGRLRWMLFKAQIKQARRLQPLRENPKFTLLELSQQQRRLWKALASRWHQRGLIEDPDDVYFLLFDELASLARRSNDPLAGARMRSRIRRRRLQYQLWKAFPAPPLRDRYGEPIAVVPEQPQETPIAESVVQPPAPPQEAPDDLPLTLRGIAASAGAAEGRAHVAESATSGRELTPGDILVARFTDPGWTPIFPLAAAVVTEIGGVLSHGAIVAREFGIPAVVNVQRATQQIRSGDLLKVDGSNGRVTILERG